MILFENISGVLIEDVSIGLTATSTEICQGANAANTKNMFPISMSVLLAENSAPLTLGK